MRSRGTRSQWSLPLSLFATLILTVVVVGYFLLFRSQREELRQEPDGIVGYIDDSIPRPFPSPLLLWGEFLSFKHETRARRASGLPASPKTRTRPIVCANRGGAKAGVRQQCDAAWGESFLQQWRGRQVEGLCEPAAESKIFCLDSPVALHAEEAANSEASRVCRFDNAIMNFKKTRVKTRSDGVTRARVLERGFLSAQCGETAKDNIGLQLYTPDIEDHHDAVCSGHFNETVLAFSHLNVRSMHHMMNDFANVLLMLRLAGLDGFTDPRTKALTFLNIDSIRKGGHYAADAPSEYFELYQKSFRRVIRASDLGPHSKACFKRLLMPPRPVVSFLAAPQSGASCDKQGPSPLLQQLSVQLQQQLMPLQQQPQTRLRIVALEHASLVRTLSQQGLLGSDVEIVSLSRRNASHAELASASVLIGSTNDELAAMFYLPLGSTRCCGVVRVSSAQEEEHSTAGTTAGLLGLHFAESVADPSALAAVLREIVAAVSTRPSCLAV